ncbi:MAG: hypothetical protein JSR54_06410, partial [Proteobacteria bacterium]|nr:hypothetical protein [Pseudomonadota bacterium]
MDRRSAADQAGSEDTMAGDPERLIRELWHPATTRRLARELAGLAADTLLLRRGPVRPPGSAARARRIVAEAATPASVVRLARQIQQASLKVSHPRF